MSIENAARKVVKRFIEPGVNTEYHNQMTDVLVKRWPLLYSAITYLVHEVELADSPSTRRKEAKEPHKMTYLGDRLILPNLTERRAALNEIPEGLASGKITPKDARDTLALAMFEVSLLTDTYRAGLLRGRPAWELKRVTVEMNSLLTDIEAAENVLASPEAPIPEPF